MPAAKQAAVARWGWLRLVLCAAGIYAAYLTQGMVQEDLSTRRCVAVALPRTTQALSPDLCRRSYGAAREQFTHVVFLNLAQSVVCMCWSGLWLLVRPAPAGSAPGWLFWRVGLSNTVGPACGVLALKNIRRASQAPRRAFMPRLTARTARPRSYTAQVLAKSCKLIPVMLARFVMDGKRYSALEFTAAALIAGTSGLVLTP